jgi:hypothetical protein
MEGEAKKSNTQNSENLHDMKKKKKKLKHFFESFPWNRSMKTQQQ